MSLFKYTMFVNSLIIQLKESGLCCTTYRVRSTPMRYGDDLATGSTSKYALDKAMNIVYQHGCT